MSFISYAQNNEDVLLHRIFGGQETGFYVDVGAFHPVIGSVTKAFYDRGWAGINVEPGAVFDELAAARPRDVNLRMVVLDRTGTALLRDDAADPGMTRVVAADEGGAAREVPCDTLEGIVNRHAGGRPVEFLKVDAEGAEGAIVLSTDWRRFRPRVLVFEATLPWSNVISNAEWEPALIAGGYNRVFFDGINCFYVPEEEAPILGRHFRVPVNVLDGVMPHHWVECRANAEAARDVARAETHAADEQVAQLSASLTAQESHFRSDRAAAEAALRAEHAAIESGLRAERAVLEDSLRAALAASESERVALATAMQAMLSEHAPAPLRRSSASAARWLARSVYGLVRPVVRPVMHRMRSFLMQPHLAALEALRDEVRRVSVTGSIVQAPSMSQQPATGLEEMRRLATEVERAVLTLAMESGSAKFGPVDLLPAPAARPGPLPPGRAPLLLPGGRRTEVEFAEADLSVGAALSASGGDWEPHVRAFLEARVGPDWNCLDIGANIGAHALSLATLAREGRVIAFEADPANHAFLARNADALPSPKARIEAVHLALWDSNTTLTIGGADELAGCSFLAEGEADAASTELALRTVVDAVADRSLSMRLAQVRAVRLDDWTREHGLDRLDIIKLDVEGAEAAVIRGADATLQRLRPIVLVEYNPACAAAYFGAAPDGLFRELEPRFATIHAIEPDGSLVLLACWEALRSRLDSGKGWEDLVCLPSPI